MNERLDTFAAALDANAARAVPRRAALLLHTVSPEDRRWLLEQLPPVERAELESLVAELRAIGIPPAPELLEDLSAVTPMPASGRGATTGLDAADPDAVLAVIAGEPVEFVARLLAMSSWRWGSEVLARIPAPRRQQVQDALARRSPAVSDVTSTLDRRLADLVEARLPVAGRPAAPVRGIAASRAAGSSAGGGLRRFLARFGVGAARSPRR